MSNQPFAGLGDKPLSFAMMGMVEGNGHPYSWSAIFNGYDAEAMAKCPYPVIPEYLRREPPDTLRIPRAQVTHIWTDNPEDAEIVAKAALIPHVVMNPEDVIGHVDAVLIATDIGHEHVARCRPFVEARLPLFVDKPLVDNAADLGTFKEWVAQGRPILSSSAMRYAKEFLPYRLSTHDLGTVRFATITTPKSWERYGIHALEAVYPILGPGFVTCRNIGTADSNILHFRHKSCADLVIAAIKDMFGAFGVLQLCGTAATAQVAFKDTLYAFKSQLLAFVDFVRTGIPPFPFSETVELMNMVIAGIQSRAQDGHEINLPSVTED